MHELMKQSLGRRIFLFLIILLISSLIGIALSFFFMFSGDTGMIISQGISSVFMFVVPPIVYYCLTRKERPMQAIGLRRISPFWMLFGGIVLMFVSLPVTNQLTLWNEGMKFGPAFQRLEDYMKALEETAKAATEKMLDVDTVGGMLLNLLIIALIPAVGEELTFRGVLQQSLTRKMNPHVAIFLLAAIFSFIHFQFYGFLPRLFLGLLLGYMFYVSGSLWTSIVMHFVNNGSVVVLYYLNARGIIDIDAEHFGETQSMWVIATSAVLTVALVVWSWRNSSAKKPSIR